MQKKLNSGFFRYEELESEGILELLRLGRPSQHDLKTYVKNLSSKMRFLGVILHEKHDSDVIFTPNASEIVKMSVF